MKRQSAERTGAPDERARAPLERTGETFANLQALPGTHAPLHQTSEIHAPEAGPAHAEETAVPAGLKSSTGGARFKGKKSNSIAQSPTPLKRGLPRFSQPENDVHALSSLQGAVKADGPGGAKALVDNKFYEKNRELLDGLELSNTKQGSKTQSMFSALTKAGQPKKFNLPVLLNEGSVVEQFYAARPEAIRLTLEQQKDIQQTFYDVRTQHDIVSDPLLLSLA